MSTVTFETKCWEGDWKYVLNPVRLRWQIESNDFDFKERVLFINNVSNPALVRFHAQKLIDQNIITKFVMVDDYAQKALKFFGLKKEDFKGGYYYSIQELVGIYICKADYLLHFSSDSAPAEKAPWIQDALELFENDKKIKVANLTWNKKYRQAKKESLSQDKNFFIGQGFSDQNYLIRVKDFRKKIFTEQHPKSKRYPKYGGELFEKRVDSWMRNHDFYRATFKHGSYLHKNFERGSVSKNITSLTFRVQKRLVSF